MIILRTLYAVVMYGAILLFCFAPMLGGCVKQERDPLAAYHVDPKAFQFMVIPW